MDRFTPQLTSVEIAGRVRLQLGTLAHGEGATLQDAADDLVHRLLRFVMAFRSSGFSVSGEMAPHPKTLDFLYELGEIAASGGDIRDRVFG